MARALDRPVDWFLFSAPARIISRREARGDTSETHADLLLEDLSRDVLLLVELKELRVPKRSRPSLTVTDVATAEKAATKARKLAGIGSEPVDDLTEFAQRLGLYSFALDLGRDGPDGSYVSLEDAGVALVNSAKEPGRRRFTLAHEIGHHFFDDEYSAEWVLSAGRGPGESLIDAFSIHLLMPRRLVTKQWEACQREGTSWEAAVRIASECAVSWTACVAQLRNLGLISKSEHKGMVSRVPSGGDFLELGVSIKQDLVGPTIPSAVSAATIRAFRKNKIGAAKALEILRGRLREDELPEPNEIPPRAQSPDHGWF